MPTLTDGWKMPEPPVEGAIPAYYWDAGEIHLYWVNPDSREPATQDGANDIEWPFGDGEDATLAELQALGFQDAED